MRSALQSIMLRYRPKAMYTGFCNACAAIASTAIASDHGDTKFLDRAG
jgi:hypothetical protein